MTYNKVKLKETIMKVVFLQHLYLYTGCCTYLCILFVNGIPAMAEIGLPDFLLGRSWKPADTPPSYGFFQ